MATPTSYAYSIASDITAHALASDRLQNEVRASAIATSLDHVGSVGDTLTIYFKDALSEGDKTALDVLVLAHSGVPLPTDATPVSLTGIATTSDLRQVVAMTVAKSKRNYNLKNVSFRPGDPSTLWNKALGGTHNRSLVALSDVTMTCYDVNDSVTTDPAAAVVTVLDYEPSFDFEAIGGWLEFPASISGGSSNAWWIAAMGVPDVPANYGGSVPFVYPADLEAIYQQRVVSDGRASQLLHYNATNHTNKMRWVIGHPVGTNPKFQIFLETFAG